MSLFPFSRFHSQKFSNFLKASFESFTATKFASSAAMCVIGNEAADLDSNVCAITYAFYLSERDGTIVYPLHRIKEKEWHLRTEIQYLFSKLALDMQQFIWWDVVEQNHRDDLVENDQTQWILVDHHDLGKNVSGKVIEVVDHHEVNEEARQRMDDSWDVRMLGSCSTLVAERLVDHVDDRAVLLLLLSTILIDTVNLDEKFKKVTPQDVKMASRLQEKLGISDEDRELLFRVVQHAKFDVSALSLDDLLRSDYKEWSIGDLKVGIASIRLPFERALEQATDANVVIETFRQEHRLDLLLVMSAFENDDKEFKRELAFYYRKDASSALQCVTIERYLTDSTLSLNGRKSIDENHGALFYFDQHNIAASRKKLVPLLFKFASMQELV